TTQRKGREQNTRVALVGYTNAGKSTLMNALTETEVLAEDRLFATLDSTVRRMEMDDHEVLLSDTVGFIRKLPHNLIESFKSTLDEVREADILLHVVDGSGRLVDDYIEVVVNTLEELGIEEKKGVIVFNKIDLMEPERLMALKKEYPKALFVSAERGIGLSKLRDEVGRLIEEDYVSFAYNVPMSHYKAVAYLHEVAVVEREHYEGNYVTIEGTTSKADQARFESMLEDIELIKE
ncbi:MAG: 50S ribosome-binding GTPase, partial [Balneolaceae bacterium]|nr:50S ribosome-binding GTPase [Balneolaceae bacterium]